jgi:hypothetical protein
MLKFMHLSDEIPSRLNRFDSITFGIQTVFLV